MAVHLATSSDYLKRTTALLPATGNSTVCFWVKFVTVSTVPAYQTAYVIMDDPGVYTNYAGMFADDMDQHLFVNVQMGVAAPGPTANTWQHYAWTQSGTTQKFYINGVLIATGTADRSAFVDGFEFLGNDTFSDGNISAAYCREWTTALTQAQIRDEMQATTAVHTTNLYMDCPLTSTILDVSGNGHNWTQVGSATFVTGPTFNANTTIDTAIALGVPPQTLTLDYGDGGSIAWYSYVPTQSTEVVVGFWAFYDYTKVDDLLISVYQGPTNTPTIWPNLTNGIEGSSSVPYQIPVTVGTTIYIKLSALSGSVLPLTSTIQISTLPGPIADVPIGSVAVNDDLDGFPIALMDGAVPNTVLTFLNFQASNSGTVMPVTGEVLVDTGSAASGATVFRLYQSDYQTFTTIPYPTNTLPSGPLVIGSDGSSLFYIVSDNASIRFHVVTAYDLTGALVASYDVGAFSIRAGCPNRTNTIFYFVTAGTGQNIKRWDLINNVAMADLPTGVANYASVPDLLYLADDTLIWGGHRAGFADLVHNINITTGATIRTYTMSASPAAIDHLATAIDDPTSFWVWMHNGNAATYASTFLNIKVSDGSVLVNQDATQYEQGQYGGDFTTIPTARFGHSNSCPFWIVRVAIAAPIPEPIGTSVEYLIRRERWFPVISRELKRQFFTKLEIDLQAGNGLSTGQGSNPLMELDWSDNGGQTFGTIHFLESGRMGAYSWRPIKRNMSYGRNRVYRIAVSDPVQWIVIGADLEAILGTS